jgi:hypothetical protein
MENKFEGRISTRIYLFAYIILVILSLYLLFLNVTLENGIAECQMEKDFYKDKTNSTIRMLYDTMDDYNNLSNRYNALVSACTDGVVK